MPRPSKPAASFIYVIGSPRPRLPVKIGVSTNPEKRLLSLRTSHHDDLFILAHGPGCHADEWALHQMFARDRLRGEWFKRSYGINNLIDFLSEGGMVRDLIAQWETTKPTINEYSKPVVVERFMQRQVMKRKKKVTHNEWDTVCSPAEWQKHFENGEISATDYARTLASLALAPNITDAEKADIEMRQAAQAGKARSHVDL